MLSTGRAELPEAGSVGTATRGFVMIAVWVPGALDEQPCWHRAAIFTAQVRVPPSGCARTRLDDSGATPTRVVPKIAVPVPSGLHEQP
ncbi:hypothetical protein GCM10009836_40930 [Pseudonocardia ailaonensis]|uniref:Uncharacterized protein n=1 Tax=Pseudonocardia ailaonensis TaxID=367279 RepID=A0ABN2NBV9_9PSEU